jgi:hypothetical protein
VDGARRGRAQVPGCGRSRLIAERSRRGSSARNADGGRKPPRCDQRATSASPSEPSARLLEQ